MNNGLTLTLVFEAMSLNYGESTGNVAELKKLSRGNEVYSYISRQALRYEIYKTLKEIYNIDDSSEPLKKGERDNDVIQFRPDANIKDYVELDLFGYMKTKSKDEDKSKDKSKSKSKGKESKDEEANASSDSEVINEEESSEDNNKKNDSAVKRVATVRITPAIALEPMRMDVEFGTNLNFAERVKSNPNLFQAEHHLSLYAFTILFELDRIGIDPNDNIILDNQERAKRVNMVIDVLQYLRRNIRGRVENLSPLFAIGGLYDIKNPFFLGRIMAKRNPYSMRSSINKDVLESVLNDKIKDNTYAGLIKGYWENEEDIIKVLKEGHALNMQDFFNTLKQKVNEYYGVK